MHIYFKQVKGNEKMNQVNMIIRGEARKVLSLDGVWQLRIDPDERGAREGWECGKEDFEYSVSVPGCVQAVKEIGNEYPSWETQNNYEGDCWYQRSFEVPKDWAGGEIWLKFGGIMPAAHIWLNGKYIVYSNQSQLAVKFDVTEAVLFGAENILVIELPWRDTGLKGGLIIGPGIYRSVELERTEKVHLEELFVRPDIKDMFSTVSGSIINDSNEVKKLSVRAMVNPAVGGEHSAEEAVYETILNDIEILQGESVAISMRIDMDGASLWSPDAPNLYVLTLQLLDNENVIDDEIIRFGMRQLEVGKECLLLNENPIMLRFVADEYYNCPNISPFVDRRLIRQRIATLKKLGFNGKRYHTHVPPEEELEICDEMGFLVHAEISVISNFNATEPYPECRTAWREKLKEIRNHPSLVIYCMGNEGSQVMFGKYDLVKQYYSDAKELAPETLVLAASGSQGEHPVENDFETPHLWSNWFKWAYDGLTSVPWGDLTHITDKGPMVIHEYSKMTVWPDPEEDKLYVEENMPRKGKYGGMGLVALEQAGMGHLLGKVVRNSRRLAAICQKIVLEEARKPYGVSGYHIHCAFRIGQNRGMADDLGKRIDPEFSDYHLSNGATALLIDRNFRGYTMTAGEPIEIEIFLSHFGDRDIVGGELLWTFEKNGIQIDSGEMKDVCFKRGKNGYLYTITTKAPEGPCKAVLKTVLINNGQTTAKNSWEFWSFPHPSHVLNRGIYSSFLDESRELDLMACYPQLCRLHDAMTTRYGVLVWSKDKDEYNIGRYLSEYTPTAVISDEWKIEHEEYVRSGGTLFLMDTGHFPESWYANNLGYDDKGYDIFSMFAPFRSGWDHGNAATILEEHALLGDFPNEGFCSLQCFSMIQGAQPLRVTELPGEVKPVIRVIPIWNTQGPQTGPAPERPDIPRRWSTEQWAYIAESKIGSGKLIICSLRLMSDPAGYYMLHKIIQCLGNKK